MHEKFHLKRLAISEQPIHKTLQVESRLSINGFSPKKNNDVIINNSKLSTDHIIHVNAKQRMNFKKCNSGKKLATKIKHFHTHLSRVKTA